MESILSTIAAPPSVKDGDCIAKASVFVSDLHLGEGATICVPAESRIIGLVRRCCRRIFGGVNAPPPIIRAPNPTEDFPDDSLFVGLLEAMRRRYADVDELTLRIGGDWLDPLAVRWRGGFADPLTERIAVAKLRKIVGAHKVFFDALADFVRAANARLVIFAGNHDQFLVWPRVQRALLRRIGGRDRIARSRIRFVDHRQQFRDVEDGVAYDHGMNMEPQNAVDPAAPIIREAYGRRLAEPVLGEPPASYMCRTLANPSRHRKPLVGRVHRTLDIWKEAATHDLTWVARMAFMLAFVCVRYVISSFFDPGKRFNPWKFFKVAAMTLGKSPDEKYAATVALETGADVVVMGHTHDPKVVVNRHITYVNSGTWALQHAFDVPQFALKWKKLRWLERSWHALVHFLRHRQSRISRQASKLAAFVMFVWLSVTFLVWSFPEREWGAWADRFSTFKWPLFVLLCLVVASAVLRIVSVKPHITDFRLLTFVLVTRAGDGTMDYDLCEYVTETRTIKKFLRKPQ